MTGRADPFALAFEPFVPGRFEAVRADLDREGVDPFHRDAFVLSRAGVELLRDIHPDSGLGEGIDELVALVHAAFLYWQQGERVVGVGRAALDAIVGEAVTGGIPGGRTAYYVELAPRRVWGTPVAGAAAEPLEGWFTVANEDILSLVAVFGLLPGRPGFTAVQVAGGPAGPLRREDGSSPFAPALAGAASAGLWSVVGGEELLELAWRVHRRVRSAGGPGPGRVEVAA